MPLPQAKPDWAAEVNTLLGQGSEFEGKLTFEGVVRIDGKLSGEVVSDDVLIIGEGAEIRAEIDIGEIIIEGTIIGNIRAKRSIEIHAPGHVQGDLATPSLQIDKGVIFEGRSTMEHLANVTPHRYESGILGGSGLNEAQIVAMPPSISGKK